MDIVTQCISSVLGSSKICGWFSTSLGRYNQFICVDSTGRSILSPHTSKTTGESKTHLSLSLSLTHTREREREMILKRLNFMEN